MALSLEDLLDQDSVIEQYFLSLPENIQRLAAAHSEEIHCEDDFRTFLLSIPPVTD